jgi:hypothetical protein
VRRSRKPPVKSRELAEARRVPTGAANALGGLPCGWARPCNVDPGVASGGIHQMCRSAIKFTAHATSFGAIEGRAAKVSRPRFQVVH